MSNLPSLNKQSKFSAKTKILALLLVVLAWRGVSMFSSPDETKAGTSDKKSTSTSDTDTVVLTSPQLPPLAIDWSFKLERDPFLNTHIVPEKVKDDSGTGKPITPDAEQRFAEIQKILKKEIKLSGTIEGANPRALINGQLYNLNDTVKGFTITAIKQRHITLTRENFEFQIKM